ncbi:metal ABC transporter solute-binding protein, Zn/Mn family [Schaalia vaccimaxillae]|uniref:metal ABC transporter solute-binding protein, Zn/Mn family n=1 Tax=Schaalia vaccimaxillae TaxID=183916 RepID=UPI0003B3CD4F|nr:zinc ABC transporter substrate-binding protein [Schaalia vaccimaxillae]
MSEPKGRLARAVAGAFVALTTALAACACTPDTTGLKAASDPDNDGQFRVVTTTGILADLVRHVAGERASVTQMVPDGADPHSWEPSLRTIRDVAYADLAFSNYLLLEQHAIIRAMDANLPAGTPSVSIAEAAAKQGATILPLVEDRSLDTVWLGMRVLGNGQRYGANRASTVDLTATAVDGPGEASSYLTTSFGDPEIGFASSDGFDAASGYKDDTTVLPADAHQHMSWAFTKPGIYRVSFEARLRTDDTTKPHILNGGTAVFAVGVSPDQVAAQENRQVLSAGHADLTVDLEDGRVDLTVDEGVLEAAGPTSASSATQSPLPAQAPPSSTAVETAAAAGLDVFSLDEVVIDVPTRTLTQAPGTSGFRSIAAPGSDVYVLPQAVLGKHVHGEIDPHLWHDARNAAAYVRVIRDSLIEVDPQGRQTYSRNAAKYIRDIEEVDAQVVELIGTIPAQNRRLVTTNDAYGYLANAYGLEVAGFVAPNPSVEPSVADRVKLAATIDDLDIPAVFLEPNLARTRSALRVTADEVGVQVCPLYGDTLDDQAPTYIDMMRFNAHSLAECLGGRTDEKE